MGIGDLGRKRERKGEEEGGNRERRKGQIGPNGTEKQLRKIQLILHEDFR